MSAPHASCSTTTNDCGIQDAPHATFVPVSASCGEYCQMQCDPGFLDCDTDPDNGCETPEERPNLHETIESSADESGGCGEPAPEAQVGSCSAFCASGFSDCDDDPGNGCETKGDCPAPHEQDDASAEASTAPVQLAVLAGAPQGLAVCGSSIVFLDGDALEHVDLGTLGKTTMLTSPGPPAGGIACDDARAYWATSGPSGELLTASFGTSTAIVLAADVDALPGIAVDGEGVYFVGGGGQLERVALDDDAGSVDWMPVAPTGASLPFALTPSADWSLADGGVYARSSDAGGASFWMSAAAATAVLTSASGAPFAVLHPDAGSDFLAALEDDAGSPALAAVANTPNPIFATTSGSDVIVAASANEIYAVSLDGGTVQTIALVGAPIANVARDPTRAYWTTQAKGAVPAALWRANLP